MRQSVVGIDMAANPKDTWAAFGEVVGPTDLRILSVEGDVEDSRLRQLIQDGQHTVVAIDAPFGWPDGFVSFVSEYHIGKTVVDVDKVDFRYRLTDKIVRDRTEKNPLSVSTDRIGIVAHRICGILASIDSCDIPPFRERGSVTRVIEVYPAATLAALRLQHAGYKSKRATRTGAAAKLRGEIIEGLSKAGLRLEGDMKAVCQENTDALDACICALTAQLYLNGSTWEAPMDECVRREGWIYFPKKTTEP